MRMQIQNQILQFISDNPGTQISTIVKGLPKIARSSVSSALTRLTLQQKITRIEGTRGIFAYTLADGESVPQVSEPVQKPVVAVLPKQKTITPYEWECRFSKAERLLKSGLCRRANHAFLELLDVTAEANLREKIINYRVKCLRGIKPAGYNSFLAGRFVGGDICE